MNHEFLIKYLAALKKTFDISDHCFQPQLEFIRDKARFKTALCSRRAGKSIGCAYDLLNTAVTKPGKAQLYLTLTRLQAKRIIWEPLKALNKEHGLGGEPNDTELTMRFQNGSIIYLSGAKDATEVAKYLGFPLVNVYIDEAQSFRPYLETLVDDVLAPTLYDYAGTLSMIGTPGPVPVGYFHDMTKSPEWSNHHWTMFDNPWLKKKSGFDPMQLVEADCKRMGVTLDSPRIQRNCFGRWVVDSDSLVLHYTTANHYDDLPMKAGWRYVIGVDLGFDDADAIAVVGWLPHDPNAYLILEKVQNKQGITELAKILDDLVKQFNPVALVMDTGGLGKKIAEELRKRYSLPIKAAEKTRKFEFLEILDDALRTKKFFASQHSRFAQDSYLLEWDKEKRTADKLTISDTYHSDIIDAVLYAYREALHWLYTPPPAPPPVIGSREWAKNEEKAMESAALMLLKKNIDMDDPANWIIPDWG